MAGPSRKRGADSGSFAFGIMPSRWDFDDDLDAAANLAPSPHTPAAQPTRPAAAEVKAPVKKQFAPGTEIAYDPELITLFKGYHRTLQQLYAEITTASHNDDFSKLEQALQKFLQLFEQQQLEEGVKLFVYLGKCLQESDLQELVVSTKQSLSRASRNLRSLVRQYIQQGVAASDAAQRQVDIETLGTGLQQIIQQKETSLFTLYLPPSSY